MLKKTNLREKLDLEKLRVKMSEERLLAEVKTILKRVSDDYNRIETNIIDQKNTLSNSFNHELLQSENIYHIEQIKKVCIDYRLRFLDSKFFKGTIPKEAISKIRELEKEHDTEIQGFKIIAPSKLFKLEDKDDPLLFAPIGNGYFYLIHQWGNDLHPLRKLMMWPFKNMINLIILVLILSYLVTLMIPMGLFSKSSSPAQFGILYFFMFNSIGSIVIFYGFALGKNFNPAIWNSKYYNA
ncbi:hypothetical protein J8L85_10905 [Maribacter sp. MMG018]|uniref:hypothetical protein n=1 Tax=Maribacter sp. MMG018 TaxID=2822688 RepID=UPI001B37ED17|nr:hypothetical protein [Maribacter sp. MMG018]MBQ4914948.1 hypothetical protein [Maribacter sp. MMG018]